MAESRAAVRYAKALLSLATDQKVADVVAKDMKHMSATIEEHAGLSQMLLSPVVRAADKKAVLTDIFSDNHKISASLIDTLIVNKRLALLDIVATKYIQLYDTLRGTQVARVTTAVPLTEALKAKVLEKVKDLTGKTTELENLIDESIIGGFILRVEDLEYNASVSNQLNKIKREFSLN
jgi:F-type H+-transporting ATPase subunit delta